MVITSDQLRHVAPQGRADLIDGFVNAFNLKASSFGISTALSTQHFAAQCAAESDGFRTFREYASGDGYDTRTDLGNTPQRDGDGRLWKGRGAIQLTGHTNYVAFAQAIGDPQILRNPALVEGPYYGTLAALWFWQRRGLTAFAERDDILSITKRINGGYNGLADRKTYLARAKKYIA